MQQARFSPLTALAALGAFLAGAALAAPAAAQGSGLTLPGSDWLWPELQARIMVQTTATSPLAPTALARTGETPALRSVQGAALFGDYVFARRELGSFRATGGLVLGSLAGVPTLAGTAGARLGLGVLDAPAAGGSDAGALPYLGFGYSSPALWGALSLTADIGLVAGRASGVAGVGRALFGNQAMDAALREMRLGPMLQFGMRYAF